MERKIIDSAGISEILDETSETVEKLGSMGRQIRGTHPKVYMLFQSTNAAITKTVGHYSESKERSREFTFRTENCIKQN